MCCQLALPCNRKDTEQVAAELTQHGLASGCYHADMEAVQRESVHMQWSSGAAPLLHSMNAEF